MDEVPIGSISDRAALRVLVEPFCRHVGWLAFFLVLAPIIGPRGYGVFVLASSGIAIAEALLTKPAIQALIDLDHIDDRHLSTGLLAVVAAGAAMSLALYAAAGTTGAMLDNTPFGDVFQSLTLLPVLGALTVVPTAWLRRQARQAPFAAATVSGLATGGGVAVALAWAGAGPWSLVAQIIVQRFVECAVLWIMAGRRVGLAWSQPHFVELVGGLDLRALVPAWPVIVRQGACLLVGLSLGPVATGLYMLAARFSEALSDIAWAQAPSRAMTAATETARRAGLVVFPAILGAASLPIVLPPLLDVRWWGAVPPGRMLLLSAIPAAILHARAAGAGNRAREARWQALQAAGCLAALAVAVPYGLVAAAIAVTAHGTAFALASLWPIRQLRRRKALTTAVRPLAAAGAAGLLLFLLAEPAALALGPVPALCLLAGSGRLCYLVIRGEAGARRPVLSFRRTNPA